jgi:hypothetical protein
MMNELEMAIGKEAYKDAMKGKGVMKVASRGEGEYVSS